jgi:hypothetical protein
VAVADTQDMAQYGVTIQGNSGGYLLIILITTPSTAATQQESKTSRRRYTKRAECLEGIMRQASSSAIGTTTQRAKVVAMLFSDAAEVEEEVPVEGEVELVAGGVDDGG